MRFNKIAIIGWEDGTAGQIETWLTSKQIFPNFELFCFIEPSPTHPSNSITKIDRAVKTFHWPTKAGFKGKPLHAEQDWPQFLIANDVTNVIVTSPNPQKRDEQIKLAQSRGMNVLSAIHPSAIIASDAVLGSGIIVHPNVFIGYCAEVGTGTILNTGTSIDHHCFIGECATIDPGVVLAGNVSIHRHAHIHTGATVINKITIGERAIVGAGSVVIRDVPSDDKVVGNPARSIQIKEPRL